MHFVGVTILPDATDVHFNQTVVSPILFNIRLTVVERSLVAIVGATASGKSSLLAAILGEMYESEASDDGQGAVYPMVVRGRVLYVPQQAWILRASVRENILFGLPFDAVRFEVFQSLHNCVE